MIYGIGTDIVSVLRIKRIVHKHKGFVKRFFTEEEATYFEQINYRAESIAGMFSAKESVVKALGTGFRDFSMKDIEIRKDDLGCPYAVLYRKAKKLFHQKKLSSIYLSISHEKEFAVSVCVIEA